MNKASTFAPSRFDQTRHLGRRPVTLGYVATMVRRQWFMLVGLAVLLGALGLGMSFLITPLYESQTVIRIIPAQGSPLDYSKDNPAPIDQAAVNTEMATIESRAVATQVVRQLNLQNDAEFLDKKQLETAAGAREDARLDMATSSVLSRLHVVQDDKSYVIRIGIRSGDPVKAARIANAWADAYLNNTAATVMDSAGRQARSSEQRLAELGSQVQAADARLASFRASVGLAASGNNGSVTDQQVAPLSVELATAESQAAAARSNLAAAESQVASGGYDAVSAVLTSGVVADLRRQRSEAEKQRADLDSRYGPKFPALIQIQQQIDALDSQIKLEARRIISGLKSDAMAADARAASLRGRLGVLKGDINRGSQAAVQADSLQRDADAKRTAYNRLAEAAQQYSQAGQSSQPLARVVQTAVPVRHPVRPNRPAMLAGGLIFGAVVGFLIIVIREGSRHTLRSPDDIEALSVKFLSSVPRLRPRQLKSNGKRRGPADFIVSTPMSAYAEAFRTIRSALQSPGGANKQVISISSTLPGEGKTTTSLSLARVAAMSGEKVILVDCDLRRAGVARGTRLQVEKGLVEVLKGTASVEDAIVADVVPQLDLLLVASPTFVAADMFSGPAMQALIDELRKSYDRIILDTPPLLGIADARTLAKHADGVLLVVKWDSTVVAAVDAALAGIEDQNANILGGVLMMVDPSSQASGAAYYAKQYSKYYSE
jgi:polysaccharide biosynthesis transport protein